MQLKTIKKAARTKGYNAMTGIFLLLLAFLTSFCGHSQTRRALLIAINNYVPETQTDMSRGSGWINLDGCINDLDAIKSVLTCRYGFTEPNLAILKNEDATRQSILINLDKLAKESIKGDVVLVYYSGHGSQVKNSLSAEKNDFRDEAIVPSDAAYGTPYIRDKELSPRFNHILDKGVLLTVIFDCCNSGSMSRGLNVKDPPKCRYLPMDTIDIKDPTKVEITATEKGALFLSASQDYETASEIINDDNQPQGAFTYAFLKALAQSPYNESADNIFQRTTAILKNKGKRQLPVMEGKQDRVKLTIWGEQPTDSKNKLYIPVLTVDPNSNTISLQGGAALNLTDSSELAQKDNSGVIIKITHVTGLASSIAKCISRNINEIKPGDLFELVAWGMPDNPNMYVYVPPEKLSYDEILNQAKKLKQFSAEQKIVWINDPTVQVANYTIDLSDQGWQLTDQNHVVKNLGLSINFTSLKKSIKKKHSSLFVHLPPYRGLMDKIELGKTSRNNAIVYGKASISNYYLTGRLGEKGLEYAWVYPGRLETDNAYMTTMPIRTNWQVVGEDTVSKALLADSLTYWALKLGRINAWLNLDPPQNNGDFPFDIALKNTNTLEIKTSGVLVDEEAYGLVLKAKPNGLSKWDGESRWIYVFQIDKYGTMNLLFPWVENVENKFPTKDIGWQEEIQLGNRNLFTISKPFGLDTYILIVSIEPVTNPQMVFNSESIHSPSKGAVSALSDLFSNFGVNQRGAKSPAPTNWSLQRLHFISVPK